MGPRYHHNYTLSDMKKYMETNEYPVGFDKPQKTAMWKFKKSFQIIDGRLFYTRKKGNAKLCIMDEDEKNKIFQKCHIDDGGQHVGVNKTHVRITSNYYWFSMVEYVTTRVKSCEGCQMNKKRKTDPQPVPEPRQLNCTEPWEVVYIDLIGILPRTPKGNKYIMTVTCHYSTWVNAYAIPDKTAISVRIKLLQLFMLMGIPSLAICNQSGDLIRSLNAELFKACGGKNIVSSSSEFECNKQMEETQKKVKSALDRLVKERQSDWDDYVEHVVAEFRMSEQDSTSVSPFGVMFSREPKMLSALQSKDYLGIGYSSSVGGVSAGSANETQVVTEKSNNVKKSKQIALSSQQKFTSLLIVCQEQINNSSS